MKSRRVTKGLAALTWPRFYALSALALGGVCVITALATGGFAHVALGFWIGFGLWTLALLVKWSLGTPPESTESRQEPPFYQALLRGPLRRAPIGWRHGLSAPTTLRAAPLARICRSHARPLMPKGRIPVEWETHRHVRSVPAVPYFGDHPNGRYISAFPTPGAQFDDDYQVNGVLRFRMPEDDVDFPLWDDDGLLPEEPELLEAGLGISAALVADLMAWGAAWNDRKPRTRQDSERHRERLRADARALVDRMRRELNDGLQIVVDLR